MCPEDVIPCQGGKSVQLRAGSLRLEGGDGSKERLVPTVISWASYFPLQASVSLCVDDLTSPDVPKVSDSLIS